MRQKTLNKVEANLAILKENNIQFIYRNQKVGYIEIKEKGAVIHCWLSTGTYRNIKTGVAGYDIKGLVQYINWIRSNKGKLTTNNDSSHTLDARIALLEQRLESCLERISVLEAKVFKRES